MGETAADTQREIGQLRTDMNAALDELEMRLRGGIRGVASVETRITRLRVRDELARRARENSTLLGVAMAAAGGAAAYAACELVAGLRERQKPQRQMERRLSQLRVSLNDRVLNVKRDAERARQRGLLLKLEPRRGGYVRVSDARPAVMPRSRREQTAMIKKLLWAGLVSVLMAVGSAVARRVADRVWRAALHEAPPEQAGEVAA